MTGSTARSPTLHKGSREIDRTRCVAVLPD